MRHPATRISNAPQFRRELETIYRFSLPEFDVPRGWLPRVELMVEILASQDLLRVTRIHSVSQQQGELQVILDGPYHAHLLAKRITRGAPDDCRFCGGRLVDPCDGGRKWCRRCPGGRLRVVRTSNPSG
jgi:hypothetical protein